MQRAWAEASSTCQFWGYTQKTIWIRSRSYDLSIVQYVDVFLWPSHFTVIRVIQHHVLNINSPSGKSKVSHTFSCHYIWSRSYHLCSLFGHVPMTFAFLITVVDVGLFLICHYNICNSHLKCTGILLRRYVRVNGQRKQAMIWSIYIWPRSHLTCDWWRHH